jgi:four helix bundle protein
MARFLQIARGSASETEHHLLLAKDIGILPEAEFRKTEQKVVEVQRMLTSLVQKVQPVRRAS